MAHTVTCIALPNGRTDSTLRLSVFFSVRLTPDPPGGSTTLGEQFPWLCSEETDWPSLISSTGFDVTIGGQHFAVDEQQIDSTDYRRVFTPQTGVGAFHFTDLSGLPIFSFPVMIVHDTLKNWYGTLGAAAGDRLPAVQQLRSALSVDEEEFGELWGHEVADPGDPPLEGSRAWFRDRVRGGEIDLSSPTAKDAFRLLALFHHPPGEPIAVPDQPAQGQSQWSSAKKTTLPTMQELVDSFDFHQIFAAIGEYSVLLRRLGFVVDLEIESEPIPPGDVGLSVTPVGEAWQDAITSSATVVPSTQVTISDDDFRARPRPKSPLLADGMLDLSSAAFQLVQVDVDGLGLKAIGFAQTLVNASDEVEPSVPSEMGVPAPRTGGLALVHSGGYLSLKEKLAANVDLSTASTGTEVWAEDVTRGYYADVFDSSAATWRSLCMRTGMYMPTDGGPELDPGEDEGVVQLAVTQAADAKDTGQDQLYLHETLLDWKGWSLVAPRPGKRIPPNEIVSSDPLPPGEVTEFPEAPAGVPLETRFVGRQLPRLRYGHRYRLRLRAADLAGNSVPYQMTDVGGGTHDSPEEAYLRFHSVGSPVLALSDDGGIAFPGRGGSMQRLAIRAKNSDPSLDGDPTSSVTDRIVFPPATTQIEAETHGMFDVTIPQADGTTKVGIDPGAYPIIVAKDGALGEVEVPQQPPPPGDGDAARYTVAKATDPTPYLPDPLSRRVSLRWLDRTGEVLADLDPVEWYTADEWPHSVPFRIRLEHGDAAPSFDPVERVLHLPVPKGDVRLLRMSSRFNRDDLALLGLWAWIVDEFTPTPDQPSLGGVQVRAVAGHHWMLTPWRDLELVHAVQQPLDLPEIAQLHALRELGMTWARIPFGARIDRASTAKVDMLAEWNDPIDDPTSDAPAHVAREARAFEVRVPVKPGLEDTPEELRRLEVPLRHEYGDTRYRRVHYRVEATSRYREYFDPKANLQFSRRSDAVETFVPNSARPSPPKILYAVPTFGWEIDEQGTRRRRGGGLRVYLERPWHSSGFGELLGAVLPESGNLEDLRGHVSEWGSDPLWESPPVPHALLNLSQFLQARTQPAQTVAPGLVPTGEIPLPGGAFQVSGLTIPGLKTKVSVAPHDVRWDPDRRLWYSDIEIDTGAAYFPFARLALARYHPRSLPNAHLSQIVLLDFLQIAPDRTLVISPLDVAPHTWAVTLSGPRYTKSSATVEPGVHHVFGLGSLLEEGLVPELFTGSVVEVRVERLDPSEGEDFGWRVEPSAIVTPKDVPRGAFWHGSVMLPGGIPDGERRRLVVVEKERYIADPEEPTTVSTELFRLGDRITYADIVPLT